MTITGIRNNKGVQEHNLRRFVPSLFAEEAHSRCSDKYDFIPTWEVLQRMQKEGFVIVQASQVRVRDSSRIAFCKHMVRLRHVSDIERPSVVGGSVLELVLRNAHDGSSLYDLMAGVFRLVCSNGMVVADSCIPGVKVKHIGDVADNVIDASYSVLNNTKQINGVISDWKGLQLTKPQQERFALRAAEIRYPEERGGSKELPIEITRLLHPRRPDDVGSDLWSVFNRVQENCIKGGIRQRNGRAARPIKGIDQDIRVNKELWQLGEKVHKVLA